MRKKPTKEHWTDRHGFVLSAASAGLPCLGTYVDLAIRYGLRSQS